MSKIKSFKELKKNGNYKYVGFVLASENSTDGQIKELGKVLLFFKEPTTKEIFIIENNNLYGVNEETPYGIFQGSIGSFNSNFDIVFDDNIATITY